MLTIDVAALIERLATALVHAARPVLATDADGTLWSGDVGVDSFEALLEQRAVRAEALPRLEAIAAHHGLRPAADATGTARALYDAYLAGAFPEPDCYAMMAWAFAGFTVSQAKDFVQQTLRRTGLSSRLHPEMQAVLSWAREHDVRVVVVSASPQLVVECGVELLGIGPRDVIATRPSMRGDTIVPGLAEPMPYGDGKVEALRRNAPDTQVIGAFGDNVFDLPMLRTAIHGVAVRPKPRLLEAAQGVPGLLELLPQKTALVSH